MNKKQTIIDNSLFLLQKRSRIISFAIIILFTIGYVLISNGILFDTYKEYEVYEDLKEYDITLSNEYYISGFFSIEQGSAEIIEKDGRYLLKLTGIKNTTYKFGIASEDDKQIMFEYYFDDNGKLVLEQVNKFNQEWEIGTVLENWENRTVPISHFSVTYPFSPCYVFLHF